MSVVQNVYSLNVHIIMYEILYLSKLVHNMPFVYNVLMRICSINAIENALGQTKDWHFLEYIF